MMVEIEEHMGAYLRTVFLGSRDIHVGRLRRNVRALSVAHPRTVCIYFPHKLVVLQSRARINDARNDAAKIIPDEGLRNCFV